MHLPKAYDSQPMRNQMFRPERYTNQYKKKPSEPKLLPTIDNEVKQNVRITCQENFNQYLSKKTDREFVIFQEAFKMYAIFSF